MAKEPARTVVAVKPADLDEHNKDMARRQAEATAARPKHMECLDPTVAKFHEDRKPLYEWKVECGIFRRAVGTKPAFIEKLTEQVVAQNEQDAWAMFCDKIGEWPSRRDAQPAITKLGKRTLRGIEDPASDE